MAAPRIALISLRKLRATLPHDDTCRLSRVPVTDMSATIYYLSDYAPARRSAERTPLAEDAAGDRQGGTFVLGLVIFAIVFVVIGVCLFDGVAAVGRVHNDCLQSARRVCGILHSAQTGVAPAATGNVLRAARRTPIAA